MVARELYPSEVRERVREDHRALRQMLDRLEVLARRVLQGKRDLVTELREQERALRDRLREHMALEERILVPALDEADAWGPERVERFHAEHVRQREILATVDEGPFPDFAYALLTWGLVRLLREDMDEEERISLNANVLHDTPVYNPEPE